jgi:molybdopterin synthase sulfur carrier subunit
MMIVNVLAFGIAKDIFGASGISIELTENSDVKALKILLEKRYSRLAAIKSYMIAVNNEYATDDKLITVADEIAIIPPVSGG